MYLQVKASEVKEYLINWLLLSRSFSKAPVADPDWLFIFDTPLPQGTSSCRKPSHVERPWEFFFQPTCCVLECVFFSFLLLNQTYRTENYGIESLVGIEDFVKMIWSNTWVSRTLERSLTGNLTKLFFSLWLYFGYAHLECSSCEVQKGKLGWWNALMSL